MTVLVFKKSEREEILDWTLHYLREVKQEVYADTDVLLIDIISSEEDIHFFVTTRIVHSIEKADWILALVEEYVCNDLQEIKGVCTPSTLFQFTVLIYLPKAQGVIRKFSGEIDDQACIYWNTEAD